jgi:hypothetical protein
MNIDIRNFGEFDFKDKVEPYIIILKDFYGRLVSNLGNYIKMIKDAKKKNNEQLRKTFENLLEKYSNIHKKEFRGIIAKFLRAMKNEKIDKKSELYKSILILRDSSKFDWRDMRSLNEFFIIFKGILSELNKLADEEQLKLLRNMDMEKLPELK